MVKSPSALKKSSHATNTVPDVDADLIDPLDAALSTTCSYLVLDIPPDRDYIGRHRLTLSRLFSAMKSADPNAAMLPCDSKPERAAGKVHCNRNACIDQLNKLPKSITQMQKCFPKGKPKRGGVTFFTDFLLLHDEKVDDVIVDMKENMHSFNTKMGKQRVQYHDVVKLRCIVLLNTKLEIPRWTEFFQKRTNELVAGGALIALSASKINDGKGFNNFGSQPAQRSKKRRKCNTWEHTQK